MEWYYDAGREQYGPLSDTDFQEAVRKRRIKDKTPVWCPGMEGWQPYSTLKAGQPGATPRAAPTLGPTPAQAAPAQPASSGKAPTLAPLATREMPVPEQPAPAAPSGSEATAAAPVPTRKYQLKPTGSPVSQRGTTVARPGGTTVARPGTTTVQGRPGGGSGPGVWCPKCGAPMTRLASKGGGLVCLRCDPVDKPLKGTPGWWKKKVRDLIVLGLFGYLSFFVWQKLQKDCDLTVFGGTLPYGMYVVFAVVAICAGASAAALLGIIKD